MKRWKCNECNSINDGQTMCWRCGAKSPFSSYRPPPCSAWEVDYDMFSRDDYTKKDKIAQRLNDGWIEMGMLPWIVEGKDAGFHVWWKRQNVEGQHHE